VTARPTKARVRPDAGRTSSGVLAAVVAAAVALAAGCGPRKWVEEPAFVSCTRRAAADAASPAAPAPPTPARSELVVKIGRDEYRADIEGDWSSPHFGAAMRPAGADADTGPSGTCLLCFDGARGRGLFISPDGIWRRLDVTREGDVAKGVARAPEHDKPPLPWKPLCKDVAPPPESGPAPRLDVLVLYSRAAMAESVKPGGLVKKKPEDRRADLERALKTALAANRVRVEVSVALDVDKDSLVPLDDVSGESVVDKASTALALMARGSGAVGRTAVAARVRAKADLVCVVCTFVESPGKGLALVGPHPRYAYALIGDEIGTPDDTHLTMLHEIGHMFGCRHPRGDDEADYLADQSAFCSPGDNYDLRVASGIRWRATIMGHSSDVRHLHWASPDMEKAACELCGKADSDVLLGKKGETDNGRWLRDHLTPVAGFGDHAADFAALKDDEWNDGK
jgi:hypothetical protein